MNMSQPHCALEQPEEMPLAHATEAIDDSVAYEASRALLAELTASVQAGLAALLARDPVRLEQATFDQRRLQRILSALRTAPVWTWNKTRSADLRLAMLQLLHLGRVHAALLAREQCWHNLLENLVSGSASAYRPPARTMPLAGRPNHGGPNQDGTSRTESRSPWEA